MSKKKKDKDLKEDKVQKQESQDSALFKNQESEEVEGESLLTKVEELSDQLLRSQAELQNVRRSASQEITKARLFGVESLAREFIAVGDNIQRALDSCSKEKVSDIIIEGLQLTLKSFESSLQSAGIEPVNPEGESFNPDHHEAISIIEDKEKEENTVIEVIQKGFTIHNRILRPAKVVVSKRPDISKKENNS